ncbi:hypothetical protein FD29_GL001687 [Companilactobacillus mindensis DSM 14500]|jgi:hypothetical protein|uniref:Uncharacterized protein n=1 Tax=Companilactobacillus mindensis DSM 14500 TaxID=1423770 RepID=A0A0R1QD49_9LACO|nr:hypothetical protein [Companilactobacillus mindensis]KRL42663.1 hypothetical protein FD29_GL001687 [Companilactobacillus mindensis DSM 14500]GEO79721.1 hypothetical protein LMI01_20520 [Companilactobacillus mindensis]
MEQVDSNLFKRGMIAMASLPRTLKYISWFEGEIITIDFGRSVDFDPKAYPKLAKIGRWIASDDSSKYYLAYKIGGEFPDKIINKVLGDLNLNGYELIHSAASYA